MASGTFSLEERITYTAGGTVSTLNTPGLASGICSFHLYFIMYKCMHILNTFKYELTSTPAVL